MGLRESATVHKLECAPMFMLDMQLTEHRRSRCTVRHESAKAPDHFFSSATAHVYRSKRQRSI
jgi:hypothetical protein